MITTLLAVAFLTTQTQPTINQKEQSDLNAKRFFDIGVAMLQQGENVIAAELFTKSLETGQLDVYGKILAYWNLFVAYTHIGDVEQLLKYLVKFAELSKVNEDSLNKEFLEKYLISDRIDFADILIQSHWMRENNLFGRRVESPFPMRSFKFFNIAAQTIPFCKDKVTQSIHRKELKDKIFEITATCGDCKESVCKKSSTETYFFQIIGG